MYLRGIVNTDCGGSFFKGVKILEKRFSSKGDRKNEIRNRRFTKRR